MLITCRSQLLKTRPNVFGRAQSCLCQRPVRCFSRKRNKQRQREGEGIRQSFNPAFFEKEVVSVLCDEYSSKPHSHSFHVLDASFGSGRRSYLLLNELRKVQRKWLPNARLRGTVPIVTERLESSSQTSAALVPPMISLTGIERHSPTASSLARYLLLKFGWKLGKFDWLRFSYIKDALWSDLLTAKTSAELRDATDGGQRHNADWITQLSSAICPQLNLFDVVLADFGYCKSQENNAADLLSFRSFDCDLDFRLSGGSFQKRRLWQLRRARRNAVSTEDDEGDDGHWQQYRNYAFGDQLYGDEEDDDDFSHEFAPRQMADDNSANRRPQKKRRPKPKRGKTEFASFDNDAIGDCDAESGEHEDDGELTAREWLRRLCKLDSANCSKLLAETLFLNGAVFDHRSKYLVANLLKEQMTLEKTENGSEYNDKNGTVKVVASENVNGKEPIDTENIDGNSAKLLLTVPTPYCSEESWNEVKHMCEAIQSEWQRSDNLKERKDDASIADTFVATVGDVIRAIKGEANANTRARRLLHPMTLSSVLDPSNCSVTRYRHPLFAVFNGLRTAVNNDWLQMAYCLRNAEKLIASGGLFVCLISEPMHSSVLCQFLHRRGLLQVEGLSQRPNSGLWQYVYPFPKEDEECVSAQNCVSANDALADGCVESDGRYEWNADFSFIMPTVSSLSEYPKRKGSRMVVLRRSDVSCDEAEMGEEKCEIEDLLQSKRCELTQSLTSETPLDEFKRAVECRNAALKLFREFPAHCSYFSKTDYYSENYQTLTQMQANAIVKSRARLVEIDPSRI